MMIKTLVPFFSAAALSVATLASAQTAPAGAPRATTSGDPAAAATTANPNPTPATVPAAPANNTGNPAARDDANATTAASSNANAQPNAAATPTSNGPVKPAAGQLLPGPDNSTPVGQTLAGSLNSVDGVNAIQRQEIESRDRLISEITQRIQSTDAKIAEMRQQGSSLQGEDKQALDKAIAEYERNKGMLQKSLDAARNANDKEWERARTSLATNYAFYVSGVAGVEVASPNAQ